MNSLRWLRENTPLLCALLVLSVLLLYAPVVHHQFLTYDDETYVTRNAHVNTGLRAENIAWAFHTLTDGHWHPVTWLSHMTDCQLFGLRPGPQHMVNVALHAANVVLLFLLLRAATGAVWRSLLVALLFAIHPLNVESVAWVAERKSLLSALFSLAALNAYVAYARGLQRKHYLLTIGFFALALMSKSMAVSLPLILMLMDYWPLARLEGPWPFHNGRRLLLEKLPLIAMSAAISALSVVAMRAQHILVKAAAEPLSMRMENAVVSYAAYLGKLFVPVNLSVFYPHPEHALPAGTIAASGMLLVGFSAVAFFLRGARYLAVGWLWFLISLLPVIGLVQVGNQAMADRYAYLPFVGIYIILAWGLVEITERVVLPRWIPTLVAAVLVLGLAIAASGYLRYWQDGVQLFTRAHLSVGRPDTTIDEGMGDSLVAAGRYNEAYGYYNEACTLAPKDYSCHYNMAEILYHDHRLTEALDEYRMAGTLTDRRSMALECLINSSEILITLGDYQTAAIQLDGALQIDPGNVAAMRLRSQAENLIKAAQGAPVLPGSSF